MIDGLCTSAICSSEQQVTVSKLELLRKQLINFSNTIFVLSRNSEKDIVLHSLGNQKII